MYPHEKSAQGEIITELIGLLFIKIASPIKSLPIIGLPPKVFPGRQFTVGARAWRIFTRKFSSGEDFSRGDPIIGHRRHMSVTALMRVWSVADTAQCSVLSALCPDLRLIFSPICCLRRYGASDKMSRNARLRVATYHAKRPPKHDNCHLRA